MASSFTVLDMALALFALAFRRRVAAASRPVAVVTFRLIDTRTLILSLQFRAWLALPQALVPLVARHGARDEVAA